MDLTLRLTLLLVLVAAGAAVTRWYRSRSARDAGLGAHDTQTGAARWPALPPDLGGETMRVPATWVIFSTPLCVSCSAVQADLERHFPHHRVVKIDATEQPELAAQYEVRRAPTTILADADGAIVERLVGPEGVRAFIGAAEEAVGAADRPGPQD